MAAVNNLVPTGNNQAHVTASGGKVYVAFQPPDVPYRPFNTDGPYRASYTVDVRAAEVVNNHDPELHRPDLIHVCALLTLAGKPDLSARVALAYLGQDGPVAT